MKKVAILLIAALVCAFSLCSCVGSDVDFTSTNDQLAALTEVKSGTSDIAVIDNVMAGYYVNKPNFNDLMLLKGDDFDFESEYYAIGFRKGGNTAAYINYALYSLQQDGTIATIAANYGLTDAINTIPLTTDPGTYDANSDFGKIKAKGKMILGYTEFEPMAYYKDNSTELSGYDIDLAKAVCAFYSITLETQLIVWETKETELNNGSIDCIWNGFTYSDERAQEISFSNNYMINRQAMVIRKSDAEKYKTYADMKSARFAAEGGSVGETTIKGAITDFIFKK